jgi:predicted nucleotide-binding protein
MWYDPEAHEYYPDKYYHVRIRLKGLRGSTYNTYYETDLTEFDLRRAIITPYMKGENFPFSTCGIVNPHDIRITIGHTSIRSSETKQRHSFGKWFLSKVSPIFDYRNSLFEDDVTRKFIYSIPGSLNVSDTNQGLERRPIPEESASKELTTEGVEDTKLESSKEKYDPKKIFIVHGHDDASKNELASFLYRIGLRPIILHEQPKGGKTIIELFEKYSAGVQYSFVLLTPDDVGGTDKEQLRARARQNVILEMGYFLGKLGRERLCCLSKGEVEPPSDMTGILFLRYKEKVEEQFYPIIEELRKAGYVVNID